MIESKADLEKAELAMASLFGEDGRKVYRISSRPGLTLFFKYRMNEDVTGKLSIQPLNDRNPYATLYPGGHDLSINDAKALWATMEQDSLALEARGEGIDGSPASE